MTLGPSELVPDYLSETKALVNPRWPEKAEGYVYVSGKLTFNDAINILAFENVDGANDDRGILLCAGTAEWVDAATFKKMLAETEARIKAAGETMKLVPINHVELARKATVTKSKP